MTETQITMQQLQHIQSILWHAKVVALQTHTKTGSHIVHKITQTQNVCNNIWNNTHMLLGKKYVNL